MTQVLALDAQALSKAFGTLSAVDHVSFSVKQGERFGLIGANGAGKSTLMKMLTTLLRPSSGDAFILGHSIIQNPDRVRKNIGYVQQMISADGSLTGFENLSLFAKLYDIPSNEQKERIHLGLETMGLMKVAHRYVREYSGGMIRRLEILQALLHRPAIVFLDEPTAGLDPIARRTLWEYILKINQNDKMALVLTTHDMEEADQNCERLAIIRAGKIAEIGSTAELKAHLGENATLDDVFIKYTHENR